MMRESSHHQTHLIHQNSLVAFSLLYLTLKIVIDATNSSTTTEQATMQALSNDFESETNCSWHNPISNETWRLIWSTEFKSEKKFQNEWIVEHEINQCNGNWVEQVHCNTNRSENIKIFDGFLMLAAMKERYFQNEFTAASITTRKFFSYGRYEIRASNPMGNFLRTSVFTRNPSESYWHENGQIDLFSFVQGTRIVRGVHFADSRNHYQSDDLSLSILNLETLHNFLTFGIEWNRQGLRFFAGSNYGPLIEFNNQSKYLKPFHQIRMQIGVGGIFFGEKNILNKIDWKCPSFLIDYVRIYEPFDGENHSLEEIPECQFRIIDPFRDHQLIDAICLEKRQKSTEDGLNHRQRA
ncbi:Beta-glucanase [Sarcoptes scabiei]|uniref:Beta-glucanase n=1 Tax=Sarcoptes scabiei TaxID=52283 RepID=A0A834RA25_SARSC|nr:Beta-glucanase [Sarcoptes scabiei]